MCLLNFWWIQKALSDLVKQFVVKWYKENIEKNKIKKVDNLEKSTLLNKMHYSKNLNPLWVNI